MKLFLNQEPFSDIIRYVYFNENQELIESDWDKRFGDRKVKIAFIGQDMNEAEIRVVLDQCLSSESEIGSEKWRQGYNDDSPVERISELID